MLRQIAIALLVMLAAAEAHAQKFLARSPDQVLVHVAAGGGFDLMARVLADRLAVSCPSR